MQRYQIAVRARARSAAWVNLNGKRWSRLALAALTFVILCGAGSGARAACTINDVANSAGAGPFNNTAAIDCINIQGSTVNGGTGNVSNTSPGTINSTAFPDAIGPTGITINNSTLTGAVTNSGSITAIGTFGAGAGILIENNASVAGGINNSGTITAGVDGIAEVVPSAAGVVNSGTINVSGTSGAGILADGVTTFTGGMSNGGTIAAPSGMIASNFLTFSGGMSNTHSITGFNGAEGFIGLFVAVDSGAAIYSGGISNSGNILAQTGIYVQLNGGSLAFNGDINNSGTINSPGNFLAAGIQLMGQRFIPAIISMNGDVINSGTISGNTGIIIDGGVSFAAGKGIINQGSITGIGGTAIDLRVATSAITVFQEAGSVTGAIRLSPNADVVNISGGVLNGNIIGQGTSNTVNFTPGAGNTFVYASPFGFSGVNQANVSSGTVVLDGSNSATSVAVNSGATLAGTGTVASAMSINAGGTFAPGDGTPGSSMAVNGSLAFQSGAAYLVQLNPSTSSFAAVTGTAALGGATVNAVFANGGYISKQYTILSTTGGVSGSFGAVANTNLPSNFTDTLSYDAKNAYLNLTLNFVPPPSGPSGPSFGPGLNINQTNVANALVNYFNSNGGIPMVYGTLTPAGLTQASGELATASQQTTFNAMGQFMGLLTDPFMNRGGGAATVPGRTGYADEALGYAGTNPRDAFAMFTKAPLAQVYDPHWSVWAAGFGGSQSTSGNTVVGSNDTTSSLAATAVGADYLFSPNTIAGFALAGGGTSFSVNGSGSGRSDLFQAGAYLRHNEGPAYISAALAYGWQDITTNRTVTVAGIDQLRAEFNANAWSGRVEGGYRFASPVSGGIGITPYAAAQFVTFGLPAYAESVISGSPAFALTYGAKDVTDVRSELGVRTDKSWAMADGILTLRGRFAWAHDYDPGRSIAATFQALPGASFVVNGAAQAADSALTTASLEMKWKNGWSAAATFEGEFSNVTTSYAGKGVVRYVW
jgi:uncharacterized protein with beta-barrel porin domain